MISVCKTDEGTEAQCRKTAWAFEYRTKGTGDHMVVFQSGHFETAEVYTDRTMESFSWNSDFETGLENVDEQHRHLVDIINAFGNGMTENNLDKTRLEKVFTELGDYADYHFKDEERLMKDRGIDERHFAHHAREHANFLHEVDALRGEIVPEDEAGLRHLLDFLIHWLAYHILGADQRMARQLESMNSGMEPVEAYDAEDRNRDRTTEPLVATLTNLFELLSSRNKQLVELNRTLEEKVARRTAALSQANRLLEELALTDVLTGLKNRRAALAALDDLWSSSLGEDVPLSCLMIDADRFKWVNDTHGHDAGDRVLQSLAWCLDNALRTDDILCRLGGDEFLAICPVTDASGIQTVAEQILIAVRSLNVSVGDESWTGSVSIGMASRKPGMQSIDDLIKSADRGVYEAKRLGRNRAEIDPEYS